MRNWLVGILKFNIIDCIRAHWREVASSVGPDEGADLENLILLPYGHLRNDVGELPNPQPFVNSKQFLVVMDDCVNEIPSTMGLSFLIRESMGFSTDEICAELKMSQFSVQGLLHRASLRLRECLQQRWFEARSPELAL